MYDPYNNIIEEQIYENPATLLIASGILRDNIVFEPGFWLSDTQAAQYGSLSVTNLNSYYRSLIDEDGVKSTGFSSSIPRLTFSGSAFNMENNTTISFWFKITSDYDWMNIFDFEDFGYLQVDGDGGVTTGTTGQTINLKQKVGRGSAAFPMEKYFSVPYNDWVNFTMVYEEFNHLFHTDYTVKGYVNGNSVYTITSFNEDVDFRNDSAEWYYFEERKDRLALVILEVDTDL